MLWLVVVKGGIGHTAGSRARQIDSAAVGSKQSSICRRLANTDRYLLHIAYGSFMIMLCNWQGCSSDTLEAFFKRQTAAVKHWVQARSMSAVVPDSSASDPHAV
jgi:hypothetical protein